jgi:hypothetical protein
MPNTVFYIPPVTFNFNITNTHLGPSSSSDVSSFIKSMTIDRPWDGQAHFTAEFQNYNNPITNYLVSSPPISAGSLPFATKPTNLFRAAGAANHKVMTGALRHHNQTAFNSVNIGISVLGQQAANMPTFLGGGYQDNQPGGSWTGYDYSYFLDIENQHRPDIVSSSPVQKAHATFSSIATAFGIPRVDLRFPDFRIRQLRMDRGTPRSWLGEIAKVYQCCMRFEGDTLIVEPASKVIPRPPAAYMPPRPQWGFKAGLNFKSFRWREVEPPPKNRFTLNRLDPQNGAIGKQRCIGKACPGRTVNMALNPPSTTVRIASTVYTGQIIDWVFVTADGKYIGSGGLTPGSYIGSSPAVQAIATYKPNVTFIIGQPGQQIPTPAESSYGYDLVAYGSAQTNSGGLLNQYKGIYPTPLTPTLINDIQHFPFSPPVTRKIINPAPVGVDQLRYGILEDFTNIEDPIIPDKMTMDDYGFSVLFAHTRKTFTGELETPFINPKIEPGHWVEIVAPMEGWPDRSIWHVDHVKLAMQNGSWNMILSLSCGLWNLV